MSIKVNSRATLVADYTLKLGAIEKREGDGDECWQLGDKEVVPLRIACANPARPAPSSKLCVDCA